MRSRLSWRLTEWEARLEAPSLLHEICKYLKLNHYQLEGKYSVTCLIQGALVKLSGMRTCRGLKWPSYRVPSSQLRKNPWLSLIFPWRFSLTLRCLFYFKMLSAARRKNAGKHLICRKSYLDQGWNLVHFSQSKIPWLSLTLNKIPWLSLTFQKKIVFPDSPWISLMPGTLFLLIHSDRQMD